MWLVIKPDNTVYQVENQKPSDDAYPSFEIKYWLGGVPQKEYYDADGALISGDIDPTLALDKNTQRALAFAGNDGVSLYELADTLDAIVEDLNGELSADTKEKAKKIKDKVKKAKDKYP
jgi:hypothetical protein